MGENEDSVERGSTEPERVEMWRLAECLRLGLEDDLAEKFAGSDSDLSRFRKLVEDRGWTPEAAYLAVF